MTEQVAIVQANPLKAFCRRVFEHLGVLPRDAEVIADVLVQADLRGVGSHRVARLRRYVNGCEKGRCRTLLRSPAD